jgi:hypothetical protein
MYINPYFNPEKLNLDILSIDNGGSYEFDIILFCSPKDSKGVVYYETDSGCSCPIPFEGFEGKNQQEVLCGMVRIENIEHALEEYKNWGGNSAWDKTDITNWLIKKGLKFKDS